MKKVLLINGHQCYDGGMQALPTFSCYDVLKNPEIDNDLRRFEQHLQQNFQGE